MEHMSTLCYIEKDGRYLMLHRTVKKHDVNKDKWIGVGGHFEEGESPEECVLREVKEETGYTLTSYQYRGLVTFISGDGVTEYMSLFTADQFTGEEIPCDEGELEWVPKEKVWGLHLWEGDKIFFRLLDEKIPFFSLKLVYDGHGRLVSAALNGKPMELFDILEEDGSKSGIVRERGVTHWEGSLHPTVHIWIVREREQGAYDVLLQKRSARKDSYPGCYDISAAGHVTAGRMFWNRRRESFRRSLASWPARRSWKQSVSIKDGQRMCFMEEHLKTMNGVMSICTGNRWSFGICGCRNRRWKKSCGWIMENACA